MTNRDQEEQDFGIDEMTVNFENMRADLATESKRFVIQALGVGAACVAAGAGLATLVLYMMGKL